MHSYVKRIFTGLCLFSVVTVMASDKNTGSFKERQIPQGASPASRAQNKGSSHPQISLDSNYKAFTGKILGSGVRLRLLPDAESHIVGDLNKNDLLVVVGEKSDFYAIEAPTEMKAYIFRSFVLDNIVEGNRVNVRLSPELNSPVIAFMNTGDQVHGTISEKNHKWLQIDVPSSVRFFVAKEYIEKVGGPEVKSIHDKKRERVIQLMDSSELLSQSEMMKPFEEIDFEKISENYNTIINDYSDFPKYASDARAKLIDLQETYLQKKLAYLESKASKMSREMAAHGELISNVETAESSMSPKERMKIWERIEESHFLEWSASHHNKTIDDFYEEQKLKCIRISGIVEPYNDLVKNKPGNYILRDRDMPKAYLYSTLVDLQGHVGKYVTLFVTSRPNNNFAFPTYFVHETE